MSEPKRLSESSDNNLERVLLRAGRAQASRGARQRALVAATAALATTGLATGTAAAGGALVKGGSAFGLKWIGVAAFVGLGAVTTVAVVEGRHTAPPTAVHPVDDPVTVAPAAQRVTGEPAATITGSVEVPVEVPAVTTVEAPVDAPIQPQPSAASPLPAPRSVPAPTAVAVPRAVPADSGTTTASSIPAELATLDQARTAMAAGNPGRALAILDDYAMRFPHGSMASEATVLRIEALVKSGNPQGAQRVADSFLKFNPQSPYAARIRSLVGGDP
jgi:hypothetical protein